MLSDFDLCFRVDVVPSLQCHVAPTKGRKCRFSKEEVAAEFVAEPTAAFSRSCFGTHEVVAGDGHGNGVDWWAFGMFVYELLYGTKPFKGGSKESTLRNIASSSVDVGFHVEEGTKRECWRLGCAKGAMDGKRHPLFAGIKWPLIRSYMPPEVRGMLRESGSNVSDVTCKRRRWWRTGPE